MKREEALEKHWLFSQNETMNGDSHERLINDIYDDFKSRVCGNCKYYNIDPVDVLNPATTSCMANNWHSIIVAYPPIDFGCNKFERKDK